MTFHDVRFPDDIAVGAVGGPRFDTAVVSLSSGREKRNVNWAEARGTWDVSHGLKTQAQLDRLIAFFRARQGKAHAFRFKDWSDFQMPRQAIGSGNGVAAGFALAKAYTDAGGYQTSRRITRPQVGSVRVWLGGVLQAGGYSVVDGAVVFAVPPGADLLVEVECEFDVPARFDTDQMKVTVEEYGTYSWGQIPVVEVRE